MNGITFHNHFYVKTGQMSVRFFVVFHDTINLRYRPRFFDQVGHQTTYASIGNKHFFNKSCLRQTYQNYEQSRQKLGTLLENKVL